LHYFGVLWLITIQVKTSDFGVKGGVARVPYLWANVLKHWLNVISGNNVFPLIVSQFNWTWHHGVSLMEIAKIALSNNDDTRDCNRIH
jgi:hypothetical protein